MLNARTYLLCVDYLEQKAHACSRLLTPAHVGGGTEKAWTWAALKALSAYFVVMTCLPSVVQVFFKQCQCPSDTAAGCPD